MVVKKLYTEKPDFFNEEGHLTDENLALYVDAMLLDKLEQLPSQITDHVDECKVCKHEIVELYEVQKQMDHSAIGAHPYFERKQAFQWSYLFRIAAILIVTFGFGYWVVYTVKDEQNQANNTSEVKDSLTISEKENLADNENEEKQNENPVNKESEAIEKVSSKELLAYNPSPLLEDLIQTNTRSSDIKVNSPLNGDTLKNNISFQWELESNEKLVLKIIDNKEEELYNYEVAGNKFVFKEKLKPGLYYWKLETKDDLVYAGKFFTK